MLKKPAHVVYQLMKFKYIYFLHQPVCNHFRKPHSQNVIPDIGTKNTLI